MQRTLLKSKLHRVHVTQCELHYIGSCAIDEDLLEAADICEYEEIQIWNVNNGERLATYAIRGERGSGMISVNGSAARRAAVGDILIIATFAGFDEQERLEHRPRLVHGDEQNRIIELPAGIPGQAAP